MISIQELRYKIRHFVSSLKNLNKLSIPSNTTFNRLIKIINNESFDQQVNKEIDFFSKKFEISNELFISYDNKGQRLNNNRLSDEGLQIFASILYLRLIISISNNDLIMNKVRYINACLKAFELIKLPDFLNSEQIPFKFLQDEVLKKLPVNGLNKKQFFYNDLRDINKTDHSDFKTIPIDVLFYEGPIARAYLEMMYSLRCKPRKIINLISERDLVTNKKVGLFLPTFLRFKYASKIQYEKINYWPKFIYKTKKNYV